MKPREVQSHAALDSGERPRWALGGLALCFPARTSVVALPIPTQANPHLRSHPARRRDIDHQRRRTRYRQPDAHRRQDDGHLSSGAGQRLRRRHPRADDEGQNDFQVQHPDGRREGRDKGYPDHTPPPACRPDRTSAPNAVAGTPRAGERRGFLYPFWQVGHPLL
ncbi:MAG: hypothetical protein SLRJCFUN_000661 [Candidatus Fervidibacter sp.]